MQTIESLLKNYELIIQYRRQQLNYKEYVKHIEAFFNGKISCGTCASAIKKAASDFERAVFGAIYKLDKNVLVKPNKELLKGTRFVNGMYDSLVTCSFDSFQTFLSQFVNDYRNNKKKMTREEFDAANKELLQFNRSRMDYFNSFEYNDYMLSITSSASPSTKSSVDDVLQAEIDEKQSRTVITEETELSEDYKTSIGKYDTQRKVDLERALQMKKEGMSNEQIGKEFGVSKQAIGKLFKKHLNNIEE